MFGDDCKVIYSYTREQAIDDGVLVDVTHLANLVGFKAPVAVSAALFHDYITPTESLKANGQTLEGRLKDVFLMTLYAMKDRWDGSRANFEVLFQMEGELTFKKVQCIVAVEGDKDGNPALTIFRPEDD